MSLVSFFVFQICSSSLHGGVRSVLLGVVVEWSFSLLRSTGSCVLSCWCDRTQGGASFWLTLGSSEFHRLSVDAGAGSLGGVLARSKPPPIGCCSLARWWTGDCLWIPLKRADPVLALSGSGVFVVTGAVGDSDRGF
ncbi:hypothetical protein ACOSQ4_017529 [Xanthoceras sorbifolium]